MRFSPPLQYLERGPGGEVSESPAYVEAKGGLMKPQSSNLSICLCLLVLLTGFQCNLFTSLFGRTAEDAATINSVETIIADMTQPHEGRPHGVPESYDWSQQPRLGMGNEAGEFTALTAWGQVYEDAAGNPATNTRVQIRDIRAYFLSRTDGAWHLLQQSQAVEGGAYVEDFVDDLSTDADMRQEADGSISITAGDGFNFHFWPSSGRAAINPEDIAGIFTTVQARLIVDNPALPDDRAQARYLLSMGADYWRDLTAEWDGFRTNGDVAIGRFKYVTVEWQAFNMTSLSAEMIRQNPPPQR